jgi:hypothetical protein
MFTKEEQRHLRWYDYFWLAIPIVGIIFMVLAVEARENEARE